MRFSMLLTGGIIVLAALQTATVAPAVLSLLGEQHADDDAAHLMPMAKILTTVSGKETSLVESSHSINAIDTKRSKKPTTNGE